MGPLVRIRNTYDWDVCVHVLPQHSQLNTDLLICPVPTVRTRSILLNPDAPQLSHSYFIVLNHCIRYYVRY